MAMPKVKGVASALVCTVAIIIFLTQSASLFSQTENSDKEIKKYAVGFSGTQFLPSNSSNKFNNFGADIFFQKKDF